MADVDYLFYIYKNGKVTDDFFVVILNGKHPQSCWKTLSTLHFKDVKDNPAHCMWISSTDADKHLGQCE